MILLIRRLFMKSANEILLDSKELLNMSKYIDRELSVLPVGSLNIVNKKNQTQYFHVRYENKKKISKYIPKEDINFAKKLAQKSYLKKVGVYITKVLNMTSNLNIILVDNEIFNIYDRLSDYRKSLVTPIKLSFEQKLNEWNLQTYEPNNYKDENLIILTKKGEKVRSKTEKIIADTLTDKGIPYKYEKPIYLEGKGIVYPDFALFSPHTHKESLWEHCGMMDDPVYCEKVLKKLRCYRENGYYIGENLIVTFESKNHIIDVKEIEDYINKYFLF